MFFSNTVRTEDMVETLRSQDAVRVCAQILKGECENFQFMLDGSFAEGPSDFSTPRLGGVLSRCSVCGFLHIERAVRLPYARLCAQSCVVFRQVPNLTTQFTSHGLG